VANLQQMAAHDRIEALYLTMAGVVRGAEELTRGKDAAYGAASDKESALEQRLGCASPPAEARLGEDTPLETDAASGWTLYVRDTLRRVLLAAGSADPCPQCGEALTPDGGGAAGSTVPSRRPLPACGCSWQWYLHLRRVLRANAFQVHSHLPYLAPTPAAPCCYAWVAGADGPAQVADGLALYAWGRLFNHSCVSNALAGMHAAGDPRRPGATLHVRAVRDIAAGEEVTLLYSEACAAGAGGSEGDGTAADAAAAATAYRRGLLAAQFGFECQCPACAQP
jgi:hypothetical protein